MGSELKLCKLIYSEESIIDAINDYAKIALVTFTMDNTYFICRFRNCTYDESLTIREFENYVIDLMNRQR